MRTRSADGISIAFQVSGRGQPALVFVHGWCCDRSYWDPQADHFAQQYTVVTIDLAGHGQSGLGREWWTMGAFGEDVVAVVRKLHLDQVVLIGHSMGGHVIVEAARRMPDCVIGLVGADTYSDVERRLTREEFDEEFASVRVSFPEATRELVRSLFAPTADPILVERVATDMSEAPPEIGLGAVQEATRHDLAQALEGVRAPIRCISSDGGTINIGAAQRHASSFEVVYMSGVGHFVMMEDPEMFNRLLAEIVDEVVSYREPTRLSPR